MLAEVLAEPSPGGDAAAGQLPTWLDVLVAAADRSSPPCLTPNPVGPGHELDQLIAPLLDEAMDMLASRVPAERDISGTAVADLRDWLRRDLSRLAGPCVDSRLAAFRVGAGPVIPDDLWLRFQQQTISSGLFDLWDTYPVLARLVAVRLIDWVDRSAEIIERFIADREALRQLLGLSGRPTLESVEAAGSDPHNGHAGVAVCTVSGRRVVYKPKDLSAEVLLSELIVWCNRTGLDLGPATEVLARDGYGWVSYVENAPVDAAGAQRFFTRIGRLTALLFALGGNDAHAENVVACGDTPVVVDAETVLQPTLPSEDGRAATGWVHDGMVLPRWLRIGGAAVDLSATGAPGTSWRRTELRWRSAGDPQMELVPVQNAVSDFPSAVRSPAGELYRPEDHEEEILDGFREGWRLLAENAAAFTRPGGWLDRLAAVRVRVLLRMTRTYIRLLDTALDPALMRSGVQRSIHLDHVARAAFDRDADGWLRLADAERRMLEDGDVPFFSVRAADPALTAADGSVLVTFEESSLLRARRRIAELDVGRLEVQCDVARASLSVAPAGCRAEAFATAPADRARAIDGTDGGAAAAAVAARMVAQVRRFGGAAAPLGLVAASPSQWSIDVPGPGLYDGRTGLAVAFAAGAAALGDRDLALLAHEVAEPVLATATARPRRLVLSYGLGGQDGVGGILLGLALVARMTSAAAENADPLELAFRTLCDAVTREEVERADPLDLLAGLPGFVAGLTAGAQLGWPIQPAIGDLARRRLMDAVTSHVAAVEAGTAAAYNGFSHGDSGLAAVLSGLVDVRTDGWEQALELTTALVAMESARFDPALSGWADLRPGAEATGRGPGWCNGSPGIALSRAVIARRLRAAGQADDSPLLATASLDLRRSRDGLGAEQLPRDTLCCGTAGRVAVLQTVAQTSLDDGGTLAGCDELFGEASGSLSSAVIEGRLRLGAPPSPLAPLGLFQGLGGVLLALAQAACPDVAPVLAWGADLGRDSADVIAVAPPDPEAESRHRDRGRTA